MAFIQANVLAGVCFVVCCLQLVAGAILLRKFNATADLRSGGGRTKLEKSLISYVLSEQICLGLLRQGRRTDLFSLCMSV